MKNITINIHPLAALLALAAVLAVGFREPTEPEERWDYEFEHIDEEELVDGLRLMVNHLPPSHAEIWSTSPRERLVAWHGDAATPLAAVEAKSEELGERDQRAHARLVALFIYRSRGRWEYAGKLFDSGEGAWVLWKRKRLD